MILVKSLSLSSLATGPKTLVPTGVLSSLINTHALSSNLIYEPSFLLTPCLVLTITALQTFPSGIFPFGIAFLTVTVTMSPMFPYLTLDPPVTLITRTALP